MFESIVQLLDDYEQYRHNTANVFTRENRDLKIRGREDLGWPPEVNLTFDTCARVPTAQLIPVLLS